MTELRAFPVLHARDVESVAAFYLRLGFSEQFGCPRHELFVYVPDVDSMVDELRLAGATILREPGDMFWGERVAYVTDPEGNLVSLANPPAP
jgi:predicted enzyme related to lactoylglutathione lyase